MSIADKILPIRARRFKTLDAYENFLEKKENKDVELRLGDLNFRNGRLNGHQVRQTGYETLLGKVGVPRTFAKKIPDDLLEYNVNRLFKENKNKPVQLRLENDVVQAVVSEKYQPVSDLDISRSFQKTLNDAFGVTNIAWDDYSSRISVTNKDKPVNVVVGDKWEGGIDLHNSGTGFHALQVNRFLLRLVCTNGMVSKEAQEASFRNIHIGDQITKYRTRLKAAIRSTAEFQGLDRLKALTTEKTDSRFLLRAERALTSVLGVEGARGFTDKSLKKEKTRYGVVNAITHLAHDFADNQFSKQRELEIIGGALAA